MQNINWRERFTMKNCFVLLLLKLQFVLLYRSTLFSMEGSNEFVFKHEAYTLCTDDEKIDETFIKKITQKELKMLLYSSVIKNSLKTYEYEKTTCVVPEIIVVPQFMNKSYLDSFLAVFGLFQRKVGTASFSKRFWYSLFNYYNQLSIESESLKEELVKHYGDAFEYAWLHKLNIDRHPDFLDRMRELQFKKSFNLAMLLVQEGTQEFAQKQIMLVPSNQEVRHVTMSKNSNKILCITDTSAHIYAKNSESQFVYLQEIKGILCGGLSPDGSTVVVAQLIKPLHFRLIFYDFEGNKLRKKGDLISY